MRGDDGCNDQSQDVELVVPWRLGRRGELRIDGDQLTWRGQSIHASEVVSVRYVESNTQLYFVRITFVTQTETLRFHVRLPTFKGHRSTDAIDAVKRWIEMRLAPYLAADLAARARRDGSVQVGSLTVEPAGLRRGRRRLPWSELHDFHLEGSAMHASRRSDTARRGFRRWSFTATWRANAVLLPHVAARLIGDPE